MKAHLSDAFVMKQELRREQFTFSLREKATFFSGVISEGIEPLLVFMKERYDTKKVYLGSSIERKDDYEVIDFIIEFYFNHKQVWDIIFANIDHPAVKKYLDEFIEMSADKYMMILETMGKGDCADRFTLSQFIHMQLNTMKTLLTSGFTKDEIISHSRIVAGMLHGAFYAIISK